MSSFRVALAVLLLAWAGACAPAPMISTGAMHTCAVDSRGTAYCWGDNFAGQLGDGVIGAALKLDVTGLASVAALGAGISHACASTTAGAAFCWGNNDAGQLGDATITSRPTPAAVSGLAGVRAFALGQGHTCALTDMGSVWCWGLNSSGQLGDGTARTRPIAAPVPGTFAAIASGDNHVCALTSSGAVKCWGRNDRGQLGDGSTTQRLVPTDAQGLAGGIVAIAAGATHSCAVDSSGGVKCWGANDGAQLGDGTAIQRNVPVDVVGLGAAARELAMSYRKTCALTSLGAVKCWGAGVDDPNPLAPPAVVAGLASGVSDIAGGQFHFCAISSLGSMRCWGTNTYGEIGDGTTNGARTPVDVVGLPAGIQGMALGGHFTCVLLPTHGVRCWGYNFFGQLGANSPREYNFAHLLTSLPAATSISAGRDHTCALLASGSVRCWGGNGRGQLGDGTAVNRPVPADVTGLGAGVRAVVAGDYYSCAITSARGVKCWGVGQLTPLDIAQLTSGVESIALGNAHACALTTSGGVKCWGANAAGQLGDGTTTPRSVPADVTGLQSGVSAIAAGATHTCALTTGGLVRCWGDNTFGQIGDNTATARSVPADVASPIGAIRAVAAGSTQTCAVTAAGAAWCWGYSAEQFLGASRGHPTLVNALANGVSALAEGDSHICALLEGGGVNCFGAHGAGQLGDGTKVLVRRAPQSVVGPDGRSFLDLTPEDALARDKLPPFVVVASGTGVSVTANIQFRPRDVGTTGGIYVFGLVPPGLLVSSGVASLKDDAPPCVLAQLTSSGQLAQVSASSLQSYATGVLSAQGQAVTVLNGVPAAQLAGSTFFVGYGTSAATMLDNGINRSVASVPGAVQCPDTLNSAAIANLPGALSGLWWNSTESGWGINFTQRRNIVFAAWYTYDLAGNPKWYVASNCVLPAAASSGTCTGSLYEVTGPTFFGTAFNPSAAQVATAGTLQVAFQNANAGTMTYAAANQTRTVAITRQPFPAGTTAPPVDYTDIWWNPDESGWGMAITHQFNVMFLAWYVYDAGGKPVWYVASNCNVNATQNACSGTLYRTTGPAFGPSFDASRVQVFTAGTVNVVFTDANNATLSFTVDGVSASKTITRQIF